MKTERLFRDVPHPRFWLWVQLFPDPAVPDTEGACWEEVPLL